MSAACSNQIQKKKRCLLCSKQVTTSGREENESLDLDLDEPSSHSRYYLKKATQKIFQYLLLPNKHLTKSIYNAVSFCTTCIPIVEEIVHLLKKKEILELQIQEKVQVLGRIVIESPVQILLGGNSAANSSLPQELWEKFKGPVTQNFMQGLLPNPSVRLKSIGLKKTEHLKSCTSTKRSSESYSKGNEELDVDVPIVVSSSSVKTFISTVVPGRSEGIADHIQDDCTKKSAIMTVDLENEFQTDDVLVEMDKKLLNEPVSSSSKMKADKCKTVADDDVEQWIKQVTQPKVANFFYSDAKKYQLCCMFCPYRVEISANKVDSERKICNHITVNHPQAKLDNLQLPRTESFENENNANHSVENRGVKRGQSESELGSTPEIIKRVKDNDIISVNYEDIESQNAQVSVPSASIQKQSTSGSTSLSRQPRTLSSSRSFDEKAMGNQSKLFFTCPKCDFVVNYDASRRHRVSARQNGLYHYVKKHLPSQSKVIYKNDDGNVGFKCTECSFFLQLHSSKNEFQITTSVMKSRKLRNLAYHYISKHDGHNECKTNSTLEVQQVEGQQQVQGQVHVQIQQVQRVQVQQQVQDKVQGQVQQIQQQQDTCHSEPELFPCPAQSCPFFVKLNDLEDRCETEQKLYDHYTASHFPVRFADVSKTPAGNDCYLCKNCDFYSVISYVGESTEVVAKCKSLLKLTKHYMKTHENLKDNIRCPVDSCTYYISKHVDVDRTMIKHYNNSHNPVTIHDISKFEGDDCYRCTECDLHFPVAYPSVSVQSDKGARNSRYLTRLKLSEHYVRTHTNFALKKQPASSSSISTQSYDNLGVNHAQVSTSYQYEDTCEDGSENFFNLNEQGNSVLHVEVMDNENEPLILIPPFLNNEGEEPSIDKDPLA